MSPIKMSKIEPALRLGIKYIEYFNTHNVDELLALLSADCVFEAYFPAPNGTIYNGKVEIEQYLRELFITKPNNKIDIEDVFGFGHKCVLQWKYYTSENRMPNNYIRGIDIINEKELLICKKYSYIKG